MAPPQHKPGAGTSCFCCALLAVGLLCALREPPPPPTPTRAPRPPRPLRTFDDVKLDLVDEGAEVPQVLEAPTASQAPRMTRRAPGLPNRTKVALLQQARSKQTNNAVTLVVAGHAHGARRQAKGGRKAAARGSLGEHAPARLLVPPEHLLQQLLEA